MANAYFTVPKAVNEPPLSYAKNSIERAQINEAIAEAKSKQANIPMTINGQKIYTEDTIKMYPPHELKHCLGEFHVGDKTHFQQAVDAALGAKEAWASTPWHERAAIFLKAADLLCTKYRAKMNAATMLCQSKNVYQAEVDAICEMADFLRFNVEYMTQIYAEQPISTPGVWNRIEYRPLEGFVFAITPFNFTAIAANLSSAPAMLGNTIVWKPADSQIYSAAVIMEIFEEAGLPNGVINMIMGDGPEMGDVIFKHKDFAGLHFTGSTAVFKHLWKEVGNNLDTYKTYPKIVGETGGKDFVVAHQSANPQQVATGLARGAFEYQGQKCSAASRAYISESIWDDVWTYLKQDMESFKVGTVENYGNFVNAVIDERAFDKIASYIDDIHASDDAEVLIGGTYDKSNGYFIQPTVVKVSDPKYRTMCEEIFGPVLTIYVFADKDFESVLDTVDQTSEYALTGSIFAVGRETIQLAADKLKNAAGNFYINDKPTGSVVAQQPFGGARGSGTNDKAGSKFNLLRWVSPLTIKETYNAPIDYRYPFLEE